MDDGRRVSVEQERVSDQCRLSSIVRRPHVDDGRRSCIEQDRKSDLGRLSSEADDLLPSQLLGDESQYLFHAHGFMR
jgi:hypothetical protein